jgi:hypothetical protein
MKLLVPLSKELSEREQLLDLLDRISKTDFGEESAPAVSQLKGLRT